jgi:predicted esterase
MAGRNDSAIVLYNTWLAANPRDNVSWYNLACAMAKTGHTEDAVRCLQNAARTGFSQVKAASDDPDLASIHNTAGFSESIRIMDSIAKSDTLPGMVRRYLPSRSIGTYVALLPPDYATSTKNYTFCVVLQGASGNEIEFAKLANEFGREGIIYIVPRAPYPNFEATQQYGTNRYIASFPDMLPNWAAVDSVTFGYLNFIKDCISDARANFRIASGRGLLFGQSQGAYYADLFALYHPSLLKAFIAHAAPMPNKHYLTDERFVALKAAGTRVTLIQSTEDNGVPFENSQKMEAAYKAHGIAAELLETKGGHYPAPATRAKIREWMDQYRN